MYNYKSCKTIKYTNIIIIKYNGISKQILLLKMLLFLILLVLLFKMSQLYLKN